MIILDDATVTAEWLIFGYRDNAGYRARFRAEQEAQRYADPQSLPDGRMNGVESVEPARGDRLAVVWCLHLFR